MSTETPGASLPATTRAYVVTVVETYIVEAASEEEAAALARELRNGPGAETVDVQVDVA